MTEDAIPELDMTPVGTYADGRPIYKRSGGLPWHRLTDTIHGDKQSAYDAAVQWCTDYKKADPFGNMAQVLGVTKTPKGWQGVINYFHSNT
ncbi:hypothetical protein [Hyphomicrobium sp.]|uniref:hypothetical protein n=1 Tax=Hyphomicrobium sp. TaxID=82 RepID=UPI001D9B6ED1|nr:hypothetical protein [Hyphomicrobium sp.]MBY0562452.1 hypothetical protein [Hyphomicrobium sp.]